MGKDALTGDWGGARTALKERGIEVSVVKGGVERQTIFADRFEFSVDTVCRS